MRADETIAEYLKPRWFVGIRRRPGKGRLGIDVFLSFRSPSPEAHGKLYRHCHGPYGDRDEALAVLRTFYGTAPTMLTPPDPALPRTMTYEF